MKHTYILFISIFILLSSSVLAKDILFIGDSHVAGTYGAELERLLKSDGNTVSRYGCVSAKAQDYVTGTFSCSQGSVFQGVQKDYTIPNIKSLLSNVPDIVIVSLGGNYPAAPELSKNLLESGVQSFDCYWVGPAFGPTTSEQTLRNFYSGLSTIAGKCKVIDALSLTDHNFCGDQRFCPGETRLHFDEYGIEGIQIAKQWAQGVFAQVTGKAVENPILSSPVIVSVGVSTSAAAVSNCSSPRCGEIDKVWLIIVRWVNSARNGQIYDTVKGWRPFQEKLPSITLVPEITRTALKQSIKNAAEVELARWDNGAKKESDPEMKPVVASYNAAGGCAGNEPTVDPWSAAFVSYVAKQAGVSDFPVSCLHTNYFRSIKNNPGLCRVYPISEHSRIQNGDIVCRCRVPGGGECTANYDNAQGFGHCDIITNTLGNGQFEAIGDNVQDNVMKKTVDLNAPGKEWFGFISCEGTRAVSSTTSENLCVASTGTPEERALLDTIAFGEGASPTPSYRYDIVALGEFVEARDPSNLYRKEGNLNLFSSYSGHPNILIRFKQGECTGGADSSCTTAAGRYQFLYGVYNSIKSQNCDKGCFKTGFGPKEQDEATLRLAASLGVTNEILKNAVATNTFIPVWDKLAPTWASFPSSAHGGEGALGQKGKSAATLQERYMFCLQVQKVKQGISSVSSTTSASSATVTPAESGTKEVQELSKECTVPAENKGKAESTGSGGCPNGMVRVDDFCIDRFEGTLVNKNTDEPFSPYCSPSADGKTTSGAIFDLKAVSLAGAIPQGYISGEQAVKACVNAEKRLCSQEEWLAACQGNAGNAFPYGSMEAAGQCNYGFGPHPPEAFFKTNDYNKIDLLDPRLNKNYGLKASGTFNQCTTPQGAFDMVGNLQEWVLPLISGGSNNPNRFAGAYYSAPLSIMSQREAGAGCGFQRVGHTSNYRDYSLGFRCCASLS